MELYRALQSRARVSMVSAIGDHELEGIARTIDSSLGIGGPDDLDGHLEQLMVASSCGPIAPKSLDLIGHSTTASSLLRLGSWVIDSADPGVIARFRAFAERSVLQRLGIHAIRLLGCNTAGTARGCETICALAEAANVEVLGTRQLLWDAHYDASGFRDVWEFLLASSNELRRMRCEPRRRGEAHATSELGPRGEAHIPSEPRGGEAHDEPGACGGWSVAHASPWPCTLELERLPATPLGPRAAHAQRVATASAARAILAVIRCNAGAPMPGLAARPTCELALPSTTPGAYHLMHVLFDGVFVRCYPGGRAAPGVVYPVEDARRLRRIIDELPLVSADR